MNSLSKNLAIGATGLAAIVSPMTSNAQELQNTNTTPLIHDAYVMSGWHSKYLGMYGFSVTDTPVIQSDVGFSIGKVNYDTWSNYDLKREKLTEVDTTLSTSFKLGKFNIAPQVIYFNSPSKDFNDSIELGARVSTANLPVNLSLYGGQIFGTGIAQGQAFDLEASKSFNLTDKLSVNVQGDLWYYHGYWVKSDGFSHASAKLSLNYNIGKGFSTSAYVKAQKELNSFGGTFKDNSAYGISVTKKF